MTLVIIVNKVKAGKVQYNLYYIKDNKLVPIGFSGLNTDYEEIKQYKRTYKDRSFVYESTKYNCYGAPVDIIRALADKFHDFQLIDNDNNGITGRDIEGFIREHNCMY
jgi:hypothetical protein